MHETDGSNVTLTWPPCMCIKGNILRPTLSVILLQGKESVKYGYEDSYKEKTSNPRKNVNTLPLLLISIKPAAS